MAAIMASLLLAGMGALGVDAEALQGATQIGQGGDSLSLDGGLGDIGFDDVVGELLVLLIGVAPGVDGEYRDDDATAESADGPEGEAGPGYRYLNGARRVVLRNGVEGWRHGVILRGLGDGDAVEGARADQGTACCTAVMMPPCTVMVPLVVPPMPTV